MEICSHCRGSRMGLVMNKTCLAATLEIWRIILSSQEDRKKDKVAEEEAEN